MRAVTAFAALATLVSLASIGVRAAEYPDIVRAAIEEARKQCVDAGGKPGPGDVIAKAEDLDGKGGEDWVLDLGKLECRGVASLFCGSGGCGLQIFLWQGGSEWKLAFDDTVRSWKRTKVGGRAALVFDFHGSVCNRVGYQRCERIYVFSNGQLVPR